MGAPGPSAGPCSAYPSTQMSQMAGTAQVLKAIDTRPNVRYPVLVPNKRGLDDVFALLDQHPSDPPLTDEISVFTAATDAFTRANLNTTIAESLSKLEPVARAALDRGLRVRGYISVAIACPYSGRVEPDKVREVAKALVEMGCYEISLGDTVGQGTPDQVSELIDEVQKSVSAEKLAVSGTGLCETQTLMQTSRGMYVTSVVTLNPELMFE